MTKEASTRKGHSKLLRHLAFWGTVLTFATSALVFHKELISYFNVRHEGGKEGSSFSQESTATNGTSANANNNSSVKIDVK